MSMRTKMKADLIAAMKLQQKEVVSALRTALGAIDNAEAVPANTPIEYQNGQAKDVARKLLTTDDIYEIIQREIDERQSKAAEFFRLGRTEEAARLQKEAEILQQYTKYRQEVSD